METLKSLIDKMDLCITKNPRGTDKMRPHFYINGFYEDAFSKYRTKRVDLLEIGFRHGASLALWSSYFQDGAVFGVDNNSDAAINDSQPQNEDWLKRKNITTIFGDAYSQSFVEAIDQSFDIVIDDGPHTLSSQISFLKLYLPKLKCDGVAVVEDLTKYGGLIIWPLLFNTPFRFEVNFLDFRRQSGLPDDMLFVVRNTGQRRLWSRIRLLARALVYTVVDPWRIARRKIKEKNLRTAM